jgi:hypothetical protein
MGRELLAVAAAEQEDEPLQVTAQFVQAVGGVANELCQRGAGAVGVTVQPLAEKLQHLGEFGGVELVGHGGSLSFLGERGRGALIGGADLLRMAACWRRG